MNTTSPKRMAFIRLDEYEGILKENFELRQLCARALAALETDHLPLDAYEQLKTDLSRAIERHANGPKNTNE